jgi:thiazole synthase
MRYFTSAGMDMASIWHCFGNYMHSVDLDEVIRMIAASGTNVIPINTHHLNSERNRQHLQIGFGGVTYDALVEAMNLQNYIMMLNINHQTSAAAAVAKTLNAREMVQVDVVKLEVLNPDLRTSADEELLQAVLELRRRRPELKLMPLFSNDLAMAQRLVDAGCPLLRVMGTPIGSGGGIVDLDTFGKICALDVPVVLDGGVGCSEHYLQAARVGAAGCLVNSMLFDTPARPSQILRRFVAEALGGLADLRVPAGSAGELHRG